MRMYALVVLFTLTFLSALLGCEQRTANTNGAPQSATQPASSPAPAGGTVIVYAALDRQFSEPLLQDFERQTGIRVEAVYDTEATKTVGLVNRIRSEALRPRCDVFWNNELVNTLRLKDEGLLAPCNPPEAANYPAEFRDADGYWFGFAARARVLIVNTSLVPHDQRPTSIRELGDPAWRGQTGIAKPLFGTTATHVACLFAALGPDAAKSMLAAWRSNDVRVASGNKAVAEMVGAGALAFSLTDTDDALIEVEAGHPVTIIFPDNDAGGLGTLLLPNTLALVKGGPNPQAGERLINYLLSAEVEARLATGPSAQIPLHSNPPQKSRVVGDTVLQPMHVDFTAAGRLFADAATYIEDTFLAP